jgi:hypothetical protein
MATFYYKGLVHNSTQDRGVSRDGYVVAKSAKDALVKIATEIGMWFHDSIRVHNGTTGKTVATSLYNQPIVSHEGRYVWVG